MVPYHCSHRQLPKYHRAYHSILPNLKPFVTLPFRFKFKINRPEYTAIHIRRGDRGGENSSPGEETFVEHMNRLFVATKLPFTIVSDSRETLQRISRLLRQSNVRVLDDVTPLPPLPIRTLRSTPRMHPGSHSLKNDASILMDARVESSFSTVLALAAQRPLLLPWS